MEISSVLKLLIAFVRLSSVIYAEESIDSSTGTKCEDVAYPDIESPFFIKFNNTFLSGSSPANCSSSIP